MLGARVKLKIYTHTDEHGQKARTKTRSAGARQLPRAPIGLVASFRPASSPGAPGGLPVANTFPCCATRRLLNKQTRARQPGLPVGRWDDSDEAPPHRAPPPPPQPRRSSLPSRTAARPAWSAWTGTPGQVGPRLCSKTTASQARKTGEFACMGARRTYLHRSRAAQSLTLTSQECPETCS